MKLVDTHAHLEAFKDVDKVLKRAKEAGVKVIVNNGICPETNRKTLELSKKYSIVKAALGLHPTLIGQFDIEEEIEFIRSKNPFAIGEIGLDYHWKKDNKEKQIELFKEMLTLAQDLKKPVIIHSRKAIKDVLKTIKEFDLKIILHSFEASQSLRALAIKENYYFSIPAIVVKNHAMQSLVKEAMIDQLLTETDSPCLSPYSGQKNEPAFVIESLKKIAETKKLTQDNAAEMIMDNFKSVMS